MCSSLYSTEMSTNVYKLRELFKYKFILPNKSGTIRATATEDVQYVPFPCVRASRCYSDVLLCWQLVQWSWTDSRQTLQSTGLEDFTTQRSRRLLASATSTILFWPSWSCSSEFYPSLHDIISGLFQRYDGLQCSKLTWSDQTVLKVFEDPTVAWIVDGFGFICPFWFKL